MKECISDLNIYNVKVVGGESVAPKTPEEEMTTHNQRIAVFVSFLSLSSSQFIYLVNIFFKYTYF